MTAALRESFRVRCVVRPRDLTREQHDLASKVVDAALAEVGINAYSFWDEEIWAYRTSGVRDGDLDMFHRARALAMEAAAIPYEVFTEDEDDE